MSKYKCSVLRVIDADTIEVELWLGFGITYRTKVRFEGYDAPETWRPSCNEEKQLGKKATDYLRKRIDEYQSPNKGHFDYDFRYILETSGDDEEGKYGRVLGRLLLGLDGVDVVEEMINMGYIKSPEWL